MSILEVTEGTQYQSASEKLARRITTTPWVSNPTSPSVVAIDEYTGADVTATVFPDVVAFPHYVGTGDDSDVIYLSLLQSLVEGHRYRILVKFIVGDNEWVFRHFVECPF